MRLAALVLSALVAACAHRSDPSPDFATTASAESQATTGSQALTPRADLTSTTLAAHIRRDAPLRYVVKPGDTLWAIAGYYLDDPWFWPQLWDANPQIRNPHLIYPGEVLTLVRGMDGSTRLTADAASGHPTVVLHPEVRVEPLAAAIPTIPYGAIRDFLHGPRLVDAGELEHAPYIVSFMDQHLVAGGGATVYVRGASASGAHRFQILRPNGPYIDAITGRILGQQALPVGQLTLTQFGAVDTGTIDQSDREVLAGDRLLPIRTEDLARDFYPHAPATPITAHIISVYGGVTSIGQYDVVTLDRGRDAGLNRGDVLSVYEAGRSVIDPVAGGAVILPEVHAGELMIFQTEQRVSFALIMRATEAIHIRDVVHSPGA